MTDAEVERRIGVECRICGEPSGFECVAIISGNPLVETLGLPVHPERGDD
jgi:hypothetical protein